MNNMNKRPLLIQSHWTDFQDCSPLINNPSISVVQKAKNYFQRIVLVCGDDARNKVIEQYAQDIDVEFYIGDLLDVSLRFEQCMETMGFEQAARVLIYCFIVNFDFVLRCFNQLGKESVDIIILPRNFDIKFGSDVFSLTFLKKFRHLIGNMKEPLAGEYRFRPWAFAEFYPQHFRISSCITSPVLEREKFQEIRNIINKYYPERFSSTGSPFTAYNMAVSLLNSNTQQVLDIACGCGEGTKLLAASFPLALGIDYSPEQIAINQQKFHGIKKLQFLVGNAMNEDLLKRNSFEAIVSIHSMEHFPDDKLFLANCLKWLKPGGELVLEVPLLMTYPFKGIDMPLGEKHIREYKLKPLLELCQAHFTIEKIFGVSRGFYVEPKMARNAMLLLLRARKNAEN